MLPRCVSLISILAEKAALPAAQRWKQNFNLGGRDAIIELYKKKTWPGNARRGRTRTFPSFLVSLFGGR